MSLTITLLFIAAVVWLIAGPIRDKRREKRTIRLCQLAVTACESRRRQIIIDTVRKTGRYSRDTASEAYRGTVIRNFLDLPFAWYDTSHWTRDEKAALGEAERIAIDREYQHQRRSVSGAAFI